MNETKAVVRGMWSVARYRLAIEEAAAIAAPVFVAQGWTWATTAGVPTERDIRATLRRLLSRALMDAKKYGRCYGGSGRLSVTCDVDEYETLTVELGLDLAARHVNPYIANKQDHALPTKAKRKPKPRRKS